MLTLGVCWSQLLSLNHKMGNMAVKFIEMTEEVPLYKDLSKIFSLNLSKITSDANRNKAPECSGL